MSAKTYSQWGGIILLVLGIVGLFTGSKVVGLNSDGLEDLIHIVVGALLVYAGFRGTAAQVVSWSKILGIVFLAVGVLGFPLKTLFGLLPGGLSTADNVVHLIYGGLGAWAGWTYKGS